jgi:hypothetical protein
MSREDPEENVMGEAKRKQQRLEKYGPAVVYHHTSTLRTNLLWMSGVIEVEGKQGPVLHPQLGEIGYGASKRRAMVDFKPLAWFTTRIAVPNVLLQAKVSFVKQGTADEIDMKPLVGAMSDVDLANAISLNRVAIGFPVAEIPVVPWPQHPGYATSEGRELNETAIEAGDDPADWYVSEEAIDLLKATEFWSSRSVVRPRLERIDRYLPDMRRMVTTCRATKGVYIPPTWLKEDQARMLAASVGVPVR